MSSRRGERPAAVFLARLPARGQHTHPPTLHFQSREKMSAVVAGNLLALAGTAKPLKRGRSATRTRRVVSAAANADDARVADVKRAVVATLASAAIALPAVRAAQMSDTPRPPPAGVPDPPLRETKNLPSNAIAVARARI